MTIQVSKVSMNKHIIHIAYEDNLTGKHIQIIFDIRQVTKWSEFNNLVLLQIDTRQYLITSYRFKQIDFNHYKTFCGICFIPFTT